MKVSVIIPFHNEMKYLSDCLDSLIAQTTMDFEAIIVCDHCESDNVNAVKEMDLPFEHQIVELAEESGVAAARNMGMSIAKGEYIAFLDCDDYLEPNCIETMLMLVEGQDVARVSLAKTWFGRNAYLENFENIVIDEEQKKNLDDENINPDDYNNWSVVMLRAIRNNYYIQQLSALGYIYKKEFLEKNKLKFNTDYKFASDIFFIITAMSKTKEVADTQDCLYVKRKHNDPVNLPSLSQIEYELDKYIEYIDAFKYIRGIFPEWADEWVTTIIDRKFIRFYSTKVVKFFSIGTKEENEILHKASKEAIALIDDKSKKYIKHYTRKLLKIAANESYTSVMKAVSKHSAKQTLKRILTSYKSLLRTIYRKVFLKRPIDEKVVMFDSFFGRYYSDSPKYIYEYLAKNYPGKFKFVWAFVNPRKQKLPYEGIKIKRQGIRYFYYLARSKYFVYNIKQPMTWQKRKGQVFLETWHGTPLKTLVFDMEEVVFASSKYKMEFYKRQLLWDYLIAPNKFSSDIFKSCFMFNNTMLETGYPRNDILYNGNNEETINGIKKNLGIPLDKKVILYAPTWREDDLVEMNNYRFKLQLDIAKMQKELGDEYVLLLRTHYLIVDAINIDEFKGFAYNGANYSDIGHLYLAADIMITDYSSVFFDYANLKRPMIFFTYDLEKYRDVMRGFYMNMEDEVPGPMVFNTDEIIHEIKNVDAMKEKYSEKYDEFYNKYCVWEDGNASKRVVEAVFKLD